MDIFEDIFKNLTTDVKDISTNTPKVDKVKKPKEDKRDISNMILEKDKLILKLQKELEEFKNSAKDLIYVDVHNTDDKKTLKNLYDEGKIVANKKGEPFILSEIKEYGMYNLGPTVHTIYCKDIIQIDYRQYYLDLCNISKGFRKKVFEKIWVHHKGYSIYDLITKEQLEYLLNNNFVSTINYSHIDLSNGYSFNTDDIYEPEDEVIKNEIKRYTDNLKNLTSKKSIKNIQVNEEI